MSFSGFDGLRRFLCAPVKLLMARHYYDPFFVFVAFARCPDYLLRVTSHLPALDTSCVSVSYQNWQLRIECLGASYRQNVVYLWTVRHGNGVRFRRVVL